MTPPKNPSYPPPVSLLLRRTRRVHLPRSQPKPGFAGRRGGRYYRVGARGKTEAPLAPLRKKEPGVYSANETSGVCFPRRVFHRNGQCLQKQCAVIARLDQPLMALGVGELRLAAGFGSARILSRSAAWCDRAFPLVSTLTRGVYSQCAVLLAPWISRTFPGPWANNRCSLRHQPVLRREDRLLFLFTSKCLRTRSRAHVPVSSGVARG